MNQMPQMPRNELPRPSEKELHSYAVELRNALKKDHLEAANVEHKLNERAAYAYDASGLLIGMRNYGEDHEAMTFPWEEAGEFERGVTEKYQCEMRGRITDAWIERVLRWLEAKADMGARYTRKEITDALGAFFWKIGEPSLDRVFKETAYMQFQRTKDGNQIQLIDKNTSHILYKGDTFSRPKNHSSAATDTRSN